MCGISAVYYSDSATLPSSSNVEALLEASLINIQHRGPDYTGTWVAPDACVDEGGLIHCIVAREIYDHERIRGEPEAKGSVFKTKSDSELVVHLYKHDSFNFLSSLAGSISAFGWKAEWDIDSVVQNGDFSDDRTVFRGLMAGHFLLFRPTGYLKTQCYWDLNYVRPDAPNKSTIEEMISTIRTHLLEAVRLRLRSDVPVGVYLSGGIDSAAVAGIAISLLREKDPNAKLATFTLAFPVTEGDMVNALEEAIYHGEQPIISSLLAGGKFLLSKFVHDKGYKVVLSGEGADEFFGGYAWLPVDNLRQPDPAGVALGLDLPSDGERQAILNRIQMATVPIFPSSKNSYSDAQIARKMLGGISAHRAFAAAVTPGAVVYNADALAVTGDPNVTSAIAEGIDARVREKAVSGKWHSLNVASYLLLNSIGERTEMAHSVESRPPFLDHRLVEIDPRLTIRPFKGENQQWMFTEKWILRQAVKPYLGYNASPSRRGARDSSPIPLQEHLKLRITQPNVERYSPTSYLEHPEFPADGSLDVRDQLLLYVLSFIVL
ncbi:putative asparagine synthase [Mycena galericulata]|nr:putative asparagine synthase [Mycena galericulata]